MSIRAHGLQELRYVTRWLRGNDRGDTAERFPIELEKLIAKDYPAKRVVAVSNAMGALHISLQLAGVGAGDEVICDALLPFGGMAAFYNNAVPVWADLNPETFNTDPASVEKLITPRTKAIICTHMMGSCCEVEKLVEMAKPRGIAVIEDCAHALFATRNGKKAGMFGDCGAFSFNWRKHLSTGQGGFLLINNEEMVAKSRYPSYGRITPRLVFNYLMPSIVAAIAMAQWPRAKEYVKNDHDWAKYFDDACAGCTWMVPQYIPPENWSSQLSWGAYFKGENRGIDHDEFMEVLKSNGGKDFEKAIMPDGAYGLPPSAAYAYPLFNEPIAYGKGCPTACPLYEGTVDYRPGLAPHAEHLVGRMLNIPLVWKNERKIKRQARALRRTIDHFGR